MLFLAALAVAASAVTTADFFSFGTSAGDTRKTGGNNGCAATVNMRTEPVFYGGQASRNAKISRDGQILFGFCNGAGIASSFPQYSKEGIAVYHADHDYRGSGDINQALYYRETNSDASEFQSRLSALGLGDFLPTSVLIVTWDGVGYRNKKADLGVTYQAAIGTDGTDSWAIFYYADMQWKESQGAKPAFGFQNRAGDEFFQLDEATVQNIENESNVGVPGVFVYKISDPSSVAVIGDPVVVDFAGHKFAAGRQPSTWSTLLQTENGEEIRMRTMAIQGGHHDYFLDTIEFVRPGCEGTMTVRAVAGKYEAEVDASACFEPLFLSGDSGLIVYSMQTGNALVGVQTHTSSDQSFSFLNVQLIHAPTTLRTACVAGLLCDEKHVEELTV